MERQKYLLSLMCLRILQTSTVTESSSAEEHFASDSRCKKTVRSLSDYVLEVICTGRTLEISPYGKSNDKAS